MNVGDNQAVRPVLHLVEDDGDWAFLFSTVFRKFKPNWEIVRSDGVPSAIDDLTRSAPPRVIITDFNMPGRNGDEMIEWIKQQPHLRDVPIFLLSSSCDHTVRMHCTLLGAWGCMKKPLSIQELRQIIAYVTRESEELRLLREERKNHPNGNQLLSNKMPIHGFNPDGISEEVPHLAAGHEYQDGANPRLLELVRLRVAELHGCKPSMKSHTAILKEMGETDERLSHVGIWESSGLFDSRERAALAFCEKITLDAGNPLPGCLIQEMLHHFTKSEVISLTVAVMSVNEWNESPPKQAA